MVGLHPGRTLLANIPGDLSLRDMPLVKLISLPRQGETRTLRSAWGALLPSCEASAKGGLRILRLAVKGDFAIFLCSDMALDTERRRR